MANGSTSEPQPARRNWVALLYFFVAALVGLGFVVTGVTMALFGLKDALFPTLGLPQYLWEVYPYEAVPAPAILPGSGVEQPERKTDLEMARERAEAKERAIDERRGHGVDRMLSGLIIAGVGAPVLIWHLRRAREMSATYDKADAPPAGDPPPTPEPAPTPTTT